MGIAVALRRRQPVVSFGVAFAAVALLPSSNFVLPAGIVLAERTLFLPSVGAMLVVGAVAVFAREQLTFRVPSSRVLDAVAASACACLLFAGGAWSLKRTLVWHDNDRLFRQAVVDSPRAYRAHFMLGAWAFENKRKREGEAEYRKALSLFPYDPFLSYSMAEQYRNAGSCSSALPLYKWTHGLDPNLRLGHTMYAWCLLEEGQIAEGRQMAVEAFRFGGDPQILNTLIAYADSAKVGDAKKRSDALSAFVKNAPSKLPDSLQKAAQKVGSGPSGR
jgi:tetratricopeptide (TPR) repeat protein